jgi:hypothetical protein
MQVAEIPYSYVSRYNESLDYKVNVSSNHIEAIVIDILHTKMRSYLHGFDS